MISRRKVAKWLAFNLLSVALTVGFAKSIPRVLTLEDAIMLSIRLSPAVKTERLQRVVDKFALRQAQHEYEVQYSLSLGGQYIQSTTQGQSAYTDSSTTTFTAGLKNTVGTSFTATANTPTANGTVSPGLTFKVTQPLMRGFGKEVNMVGLRNAEDAEYINRLTLRNMIASTITEITKEYRQVVSSKNQLKIQYLSLKKAEVTLKDTHLKIKAGKMAPADAVQAEAEIAKVKLSIKKAENALSDNKHKLLNDIGLDPRTEVDVVDDINVDKLEIPDMDKSLSLGLSNNYEYQKSVLSRRQLERQLIQAKDKARIELNLSLSAQFGGGSSISGQAGLANLAPTNNSSQNVALDAKIPIDDYSIKSALLSARTAIDKEEITMARSKRDFETKVINSIRDLQINKTSLDLAKQSRDLAQKSLEIAKVKLKYGRVSIFEVNSLQSSLTSAEVSLIDTQISYLNALTDLQLMLGTTLDSWGIKLRMDE